MEKKWAHGGVEGHRNRCLGKKGDFRLVNIAPDNKKHQVQGLFIFII